MVARVSRSRFVTATRGRPRVGAPDTGGGTVVERRVFFVFTAVSADVRPSVRPSDDDHDDGRGPCAAAAFKTISSPVVASAARRLVVPGPVPYAT